MCPAQVRVFFDNPSAQYSPGDALTGKVILILKRDKQILGIDMNLIGKTKVTYARFERQAVHRRHPRQSSVYRDKCFIVKDCKSLHRENTDCPDEHRLAMGTYEYPFSWILPENIPASFEGPYGWIRYRMEVVVRHSFWDHRCESEAEFYVLGHHDLNTLGCIMRVVQVESKWINMYGVYGGMYLELTMELERRAYTPGEIIRFATTADFQSQGHPPIPGVKVTLIQEQTYKIKDQMRRHIGKVYESLGPMVFSNSIEVWNSTIEVPPLPPTSLGGDSKFIDVQYFLRARLAVSENDAVEITFKLQIGTVPLVRQRRRPRNAPAAVAPPVATLERDFSMSIELPQTSTTEPEEVSGVLRNSIWTQPEAMNLLPVPGQPSRRASAPPFLDEISPLVTDEIPGPSAPAAVFILPETPPPTYSDALFLGSVGFLDFPRNEISSTDADDAPPAYPTQPPFFLRKGAKHLYDSNNGYSTL